MNEKMRFRITEKVRGPVRKKVGATPGEATFAPREALDFLKRFDAPVGPVEEMIEESVAGFYS
jgi:hypothetical protein